MTPIRDRAKAILDDIEKKTPIRSHDKTGYYQKYTGGLKHETMEANWKKGGIMTGCNAFVGWYAAQLGSQKYLGRFDLPSYLPSIGKSHAWVKSSKNNQPQYGDILLHAGLHVDVALGFDGKALVRMAAGQGGRSAGCDVLNKVRGKSDYNPANLQGWIDLDLYFGPGAAVNPLPDWLPGWWTVTWRGDRYFYFFDRDYNVQWTRNAPASIGQPPGAANDTGSVTMESAAAVTVRWGTTGSLERFVLLPAVGSMQMKGTWNGSEPLLSVRM